MKITAKTTKQELKNILGANAKAVKEKDKKLFDSIAYADKMAKTDDSKVTRKDLADLVKAVQKLLGDALVEPALAEEKHEETAEPKAENSVKKLQKGSKKQKKAKEEETEEPKKEEKVDTKKSAKKSLDKKSKEGDTSSSKKKNVQTKAMVLAEVFPETLELEGQTYELAKDIANMGQLHDKVIEDNESIIFAMYWTARHIKQFGYGVAPLEAPKQFPMDLDIASCVHVSEECVVAYAISRYTEVCYMFNPDDIEEFEGLRYAGGVEYQIYRLVE